jgi:hypothetical protein
VAGATGEGLDEVHGAQVYSDEVEVVVGLTGEGVEEEVHCCHSYGVVVVVVVGFTGATGLEEVHCCHS